MGRRWDFLILSALITMWWVAASLPRIGMADKWGEDWSAGWPVKFEKWGVRPDGVEYGHSFSVRAVALDVAAWLAAVSVLWGVVGLWTSCTAIRRCPTTLQNHSGGKAEAGTAT
jgi:hypothetical protein